MISISSKPNNGIFVFEKEMEWKGKNKRAFVYKKQKRFSSSVTQTQPSEENSVIP
jgi:hypothetical protein